MSWGNNSPPESAVLVLFGAPRVRGYLDACGGDVADALALYRWNTQISGAYWETLGHVEIVLRNVLAERMAARHAAAGRAGAWLDDPAGELDERARRDITAARQRVRSKGKSASDGQTLAELSFGFWRFLLAKRYTALWPALAGGFPHAPNRSRTTIERPVTRLHEFRNRLAHHERIWSQPIEDRYADITELLSYIDPDLAGWVVTGCRVPEPPIDEGGVIERGAPITPPYRQTWRGGMAPASGPICGLCQLPRRGSWLVGFSPPMAGRQASAHRELARPLVSAVTTAPGRVGADLLRDRRRTGPAGESIRVAL